MSDFRSCVFFTMPTSGTGSLWRVITALTAGRATADKVAERHVLEGRGDALSHWVPAPRGHVYMYNTPHVVNAALLDPAVRLIVNFRDLRDLACNQYHWVFQHPMPGRSEAEIERRRAEVRAGGIDRYVLSIDNTVHMRGFLALEQRLREDRENVLLLSYAQLCLDFDGMIERLCRFLDVAPGDVPRALIEAERAGNLAGNPQWIGQQWAGCDVAPGRHREELRPETIALLDARYSASLALLRALEAEPFRALLMPATPAPAMPDPPVEVLRGKQGMLFLHGDSNDVIGQITGRVRLRDLDMFAVAMAHQTRHLLGRTLCRYDYVHALVPDKEVVMRDRLPETVGFESEGPRPLRQYLASAVARLWTPFYDPGALAMDGYPLTDTHWTHGGALRYWRSLLSARLPGLLQRFDDMPMRRFAGRQLGDLGAKLGLGPEAVEIVAPAEPSARLLFENGIVNDGAVAWYGNPRGGAGRALVLHDSFANWLKDIIAELFGETVFVHGTVFDAEFVRAFDPSVVLCLQIERFFPRPPVASASLLDFVAREEKAKGARAAVRDFALDHLRRRSDPPT